MSLKEVKTIGYDFFADHLLWAFDLYASNRNSRLKEKRSYSSKQDVYVDELNEKLIQGLCDQTHDVNILVNGLLDFSEVATSYVLSKSIVTSLSKEQLYQRYAKHILCPLLVAYMEVFSEFHDGSPFMRHLDTLLLSIDERGVAFAARKMLLSILAAPECASYREDLTEFIRDLRSDRIQRRATIEQKICLAKTTFSHIKNPEEKQKCESSLTKLQDTYMACMVALYFDIKTGLGCYLARQHQIASTERACFCEIRVDSLSSSIANFIALQQHVGNELPKDTKTHLDRLWGVAVKGVSLKTSPYIRQNVNTVFYLLGKTGFSIERITDCNKSEKFFHRVATQADIHHLKPYALMLQVLYHIKNEQLQEALNLLESDEACLLDNVIGSLPYYAAVLFLGLTIKTNPTKLKNGNFNPLVQIIINTQELYADIRLDSASLLNMEFESFISDSYIHSLLRSIRKYNSIVASNLSSPKNRTHLYILNAWDSMEERLETIYTKLINVSTNDRVEAIKLLLTKADKEKVLITYLPNSTLYHCLRELDGLQSYLPILRDHHPYTKHILRDIEYRKALLMALDPKQYEKDTRHQLE